MNLVVHEIPHEYGWHTDKNYLNGVTRLAGFLIIKMRFYGIIYQLEKKR